MQVTREDLQHLASQPLGAEHLQTEAEQKFGTEEKRSGELVEMCKRVGKKWLPLGKLPPKKRMTKAQIAEHQIDIEDAIEAAGGKRGGVS